MKMETCMSLLVGVSLTLLMTTSLFNEISATRTRKAVINGTTRNPHSSLQATEAAGGLGLYKSVRNGHLNQHVPNPPSPHKRSNAYSSFAAQPDGHVHKPRPPHKSSNAYSSFEGVAAAHCDGNTPNCPPNKPRPPHESSNAYSSFEGVAAAHCDRNSPNCPPNLQEKVQRMKVNDKGEVMRDKKTSIKA